MRISKEQELSQVIQKAIREAIQGVQRIPESIEDLSFKRKENRVEVPKPVQQTLEWQLKTPDVESPHVETPSYTENVREEVEVLPVDDAL